jgi:hypothetical protein
MTWTYGKQARRVLRLYRTLLARIFAYAHQVANGQGQLPRRSNCKGPPRITVCSHSLWDMAAGDLTNHEIIVGKQRMVFYRWNSVEIEQKY